MSHETIELLRSAALFHASRGSAEEVFAKCSVADFLPGHQQDVASIIVSIINRGDPVDPMTVMTMCGEHSAALSKFFAVEVSEWFYGTPGYCATKVREHADRERAVAAVTRAAHRLESSGDTDSVVGELLDDLSALRAAQDSGLGTITFDDLMATPDDYRKWVIPGMLRTNERLVITGPEGGGKSVLIAQLCLGAAMGMNTMSPLLDSHDPLRVLMLDVENDRLQIKANMRKIHPYLDELSGGRKPTIEWVDVRDINLADTVERQKIIRLAKERMPQLLYMGSLYKLAPEGDKVDQQFGHVSRAVDRIRAETGTSILIEAHTGHGMNNDRNGAMRPYGSSMWLRWPEFGMAMIPQRGKPVQIKHWRGGRSDDRVWPGGLRRGNVMPWEPIPQDEWEARFE